ncbi:hypothetical protein B0H10DRAFT_1305648 [Mycena sp. CBHHK59/15]|nr:hypothetical protein B0H10DRAFT_1305648 [Mycena sp. CBHHK59/15]
MRSYNWGFGNLGILNRMFRPCTDLAQEVATITSVDCFHAAYNTLLNACGPSCSHLTMSETSHFSNAEVLALNVATTVGPIFIGNILNWMLMGTLITQMYTYYQKFTRDRAWIRILDYHVDRPRLVVHHQIWGKPQEFDFIPWSACMIVFMCGLIAGIVQLFYAWRLWALAWSKIMIAVVILIVLLALTQSLSAMVTAVLLLLSPEQKTVLRLHPGFSVWLAGSLATDVLITTCMTYILYSAKMRTPWADSVTMLGRLVNITVQTGLATVVTACIDLILFLHFSTTDYHLVPAYILGKLYSNSLLLSLNMRNSRSAHTTPTQPSESLPMEYFTSPITHNTISADLERRTTRQTNPNTTEPENHSDLWDTNIQNKRYSDGHDSREHRVDVVTVDINKIINEDMNGARGGAS